MIKPVCDGLVTLLEGEMAFINQSMKDTGMTLKKIYSFESTNVPLGNYPCIMVGNASMKKGWVAAPYLIEIRYEIELSGYIVWAENKANADAIKSFADAVSEVFESTKNETFQISDASGSYIVHYHSEPPLDEMRTDFAYIGDAICRSWYATWHGWITRQTLKDTP